MLKLNKIFIYIICGFTIASCDKVEGPYSETAQSNGNLNDTVRKVLLEDYTGHKCQGCPAAHDEAHALEGVFGDQVIVIAVHAGYWTSVNASGSFTYDFKTPEGTELYTALIPSTQPFPTGSVNRKLYGSQRVVDYPKWGGKIDTLLQSEPDAIIKLEPSFNFSARIISTEVTTSILNDIAGDIALSILYIEDSIINWQAFPIPPAGPGNTATYVHQHVLRGSLNGAWGNIIATNSSAGQVLDNFYSGTVIAADINTANVSVVAVLFNNTTKEVIQVEKQKLIP
jgi:hypothetical protein